MAIVKMFRTISGEDVIAEYVETIEDGDVYINAIQLVVVPSKQNPNEQSYGFAPFPQYAQPKSKGKITFNKSVISFFIEIEDQFIEQYNIIYGHIVTPPSKIILGK